MNYLVNLLVGSPVNTPVLQSVIWFSCLLIDSPRLKPCKWWSENFSTYIYKTNVYNLETLHDTFTLVLYWSFQTLRAPDSYEPLKHVIFGSVLSQLCLEPENQTVWKQTGHLFLVYWILFAQVKFNHTLYYIITPTAALPISDKQQYTNTADGSVQTDGQQTLSAAVMDFCKRKYIDIITILDLYAWTHEHLSVHTLL